MVVEFELPCVRVCKTELARMQFSWLPVEEVRCMPPGMLGVVPLSGTMHVHACVRSELQLQNCTGSALLQAEL